MSFFDLLVPSGWVRIDPRQPDPSTLQGLAHGFALRGPAAQRAQLAGALRRSLQEMCLNLAESGALVAFMPGPTTPISIWQPVVAISRLSWGEGVEPLPALIAMAAKDQSAEVYPLEVAVALRVHSSTQVDRNDIAVTISGLDIAPAAGQSAEDIALRERISVSCERFRYLIGLPSDADSWVEATCVATIVGLPDQPDPVPLVREAFDDLLSTFEWTP